MLSPAEACLATEAPDGLKALRRPWVAVQALVWAAGAAEIVALFVRPAWGLAAFWNVLIPVAPALLVLAPGLWRNVCPLGTTSLLPARSGRSARRRLSVAWQGRLAFVSVVLLFAIVPLRPVVLNTSGPATAVTLVVLAAVAVSAGAVLDSKSGWCSGLCPVHPVEKLYGASPAVTLPNAQCGECRVCVARCPDSTPDVYAIRSSPGSARWTATELLVGAFPGFVWGWFRAADGCGVAEAYGWSLGGGAATLAAYAAVSVALPSRRALVRRLFAAAAVSTYYAFRVPELAGFGTPLRRLVDLSGLLPGWFPWASAAAATAFFFAWLVLRGGPARAWLQRPEIAR